MIVVLIVAYCACSFITGTIAHRSSSSANDDDVPLIVDVIAGVLWPVVVAIVLVEFAGALISGLFHGDDDQ